MLELLSSLKKGALLVYIYDLPNSCFTRWVFPILLLP